MNNVQQCMSDDGNTHLTQKKHGKPHVKKKLKIGKLDEKGCHPSISCGMSVLTPSNTGANVGSPVRRQLDESLL